MTRRMSGACFTAAAKARTSVVISLTGEMRAAMPNTTVLSVGVRPMPRSHSSRGTVLSGVEKSTPLYSGKMRCGSNPREIRSWRMPSETPIHASKRRSATLLMLP